MKQVLKKIIPLQILDKYWRYVMSRRFRKFTKYDSNIFLKHSSLLYNNTESKHLGKIILNYHVIEKGLTMPEMRLGFGKHVLMLLIDDCLSYKIRYNSDNVQFLHAVSVIDEYNRLHLENNYKLDTNIQLNITVLLDGIKSIPTSEQICTTNDDYFVSQKAPFDKFSSSRHSVRNFEGSVELSSIKSAVEIAQNAPSSCNRQPSRIHIIENKILIASILDIQNGNRGFGHLVDKLIVLTADLSVYQSGEERSCAFVDGGMYAMNLLYGLHFNKIATCSLNWCRDPEEDLKLHKIVNIPESEVIILLIACGKIPEKFKIANSKRYDFEKVTFIH